MNSFDKRKAEILDLAHIAAATRRRKRTAVRIGATTALVATVAWFAWPDAQPPTPIAQQAPVDPVIEPLPPTPERTSAVTFISAQPLRHITLLDDDRLLDTLADNGLDAGLAYVDGKAVFVPQGWEVD